MKKTVLLAATLIMNLVIAQTPVAKKSGNVIDQYENSQPQDFSVPPPPINLFPAQFPGGNKEFLKRISKNMKKEIIDTLRHNLRTEIILKIDDVGKVLNISTRGSNKNFNLEVMKSAQKATENIQWNPAKNKQGLKVIDIVRLPYVIKIVE